MSTMPNELLNDYETTLRIHPFHFHNSNRCPASVYAYGITEDNIDKAVIRITFKGVQQTEHWKTKTIQTGEEIAKVWMEEFDQLKEYTNDPNGLPGDVRYRLSDTEKNALEITIWKSTYCSIQTAISKSDVALNGITLLDHLLMFVAFRLSMTQIAWYKFAYDSDFDIPIMRDRKFIKAYDFVDEDFRMTPVIRVKQTACSHDPTSDILIGVEFSLHHSDSAKSVLVDHFRSYARKAHIHTGIGKLCLGVHPKANVMTFWTSVYGRDPDLSCHPRLREFLTSPLDLVDVDNILDMFSDVVSKELSKDRWYDLLYTPPFPVFLDDNRLVSTSGSTGCEVASMDMS